MHDQIINSDLDGRMFFGLTYTVIGFVAEICFLAQSQLSDSFRSSIPLSGATSHSCLLLHCQML